MIFKLIKVFSLIVLVLIGITLAQQNQSHRPLNSNLKEKVSEPNSNTANTSNKLQAPADLSAIDILTLADAKETIGKDATISFYTNPSNDRRSDCNYSVGNASTRNYHSLYLHLETFPSERQAVAANLLAIKIRELNNAEKDGPDYWKLKPIYGIGDRSVLETAGETTTIYFQKNNAMFELRSLNYYTPISIDKLKLAAQQIVKRFLATIPKDQQH